MNYHPAEKKVLALLLVLKAGYTQLAGLIRQGVHSVLNAEMGNEIKITLRPSSSICSAAIITALYCGTREGNRVRIHPVVACAGTNFLSINESLELMTPPNKGSATTRMSPSLLYACLPNCVAITRLANSPCNECFP